LRTRAEIYQAMGKPGDAVSTIENAIRYAEGLPSEQRPEGMLPSLRKKLDEVRAPGKS
jgi:hypothetical protein